MRVDAEISGTKNKWLFHGQRKYGSGLKMTDVTLTDDTKRMRNWFAQWVRHFGDGEWKLIDVDEVGSDADCQRRIRKIINRHERTKKVFFGRCESIVRGKYGWIYQRWRLCRRWLPISCRNTEWRFDFSKVLGNSWNSWNFENHREKRIIRCV